MTIARIFNANVDTYSTKRAKRWTASSLWQMIKNDFLFTGKIAISSNGEKKIIDTGIKLFTEKEVEKARYYMTQRHRKGKKRDEKSTDFLLHGIAECGACEKDWKMSIQDYTPMGKPYRYYRCRYCGKGVDATKADMRTWDALITTFSDPEKLRTSILAEDFIPDCERRDIEALEKSAKTRLNEIEQSKERLNDLYVRGKIKPIQYETLTLDLEKEEKKTKEDLRRAENTLANTTLMAEGIKKATELVAKQVVYMASLSGVYDTFKDIEDVDPEIVMAEVKRIVEKSKGFAMDILDGKTSDIRYLIYEQKRRVLNELTLAGGKILLLKGGVEITGAVPTNNNIYPFNLGLSKDKYMLYNALRHCLMPDINLRVIHISR